VRTTSRVAAFIAATIATLITLVAPSGAASPALAAPPTTNVTIVGYSTTLTIDGKPVTATSSVGPQVFPPTGYHGFTPQNPYWSFGDSLGYGSEQINYSTWFEQWGWTMDPSLYSLVDGLVTENADLYCGSTKVTNYGPPAQPPSYWYHGSKGAITTSCSYSTKLVATFKTTNGGNAVERAQWNWFVSLV